MRKRLAFVRRDTRDLFPASVYVGDGKTFDAEVKHPIHGQPFRPEVTFWIDAATRVIVGHSVSLNENTHGVVEALRRACEHRCIPALIYTDRGSGFTSGGMADPVVGFAARASISHMKAWPYNSQAKGLVERVNQILTPLAKRYPTYVGTDMDKEARQLAFKTTRSEIATLGTSRALPDFQAFLADLDETVAAYNDRPHSSLPKVRANGRERRMTPNECWATRCADGFEPIRPDAAELDDMFRPYMMRVAQRGEVSLFGNRYFDHALVDWNGEQVAVGYDLRDASRVWVRELDVTDRGREPGRLIAVAGFEANSARFVPVTAERAAMERRAQGRLRRVERKRDEVLAELHPALIEHAPGATVVPFGPPHERTALTPSAAANDAVAPAAPSAPVTLGPGGRPRFTEDCQLASWLLLNPGEATASDLDWLRTQLRSAASRDSLSLEGVDVEALRRLVRGDSARAGQEIRT